MLESIIPGSILLILMIRGTITITWPSMQVSMALPLAYSGYFKQYCRLLPSAIFFLQDSKSQNCLTMKSIFILLILIGQIPSFAQLKNGDRVFSTMLSNLEFGHMKATRTSPFTDPAFQNADAF